MIYGISIYPGLDNTINENISLLDCASAKGFTHLFLSFNIPETNLTNFKTELQTLLHLAKDKNFDIISDISPASLKLFGFDAFNLDVLATTGITTLRLDFGYSPKEIAFFSNNNLGLKIQLNASTITSELLHDLAFYDANFNNITALHNYYPREYTGLSEACFIEKNRLLKAYRIKVFAFVHSCNKRRSPIFAGLPTLESHRSMSTSLAARHLGALGVNGIFIGDTLPSVDELHDVALCQSSETIIKANLLSDISFYKELLNNKFTTREDESEFVIRSVEGREYIKKHHYEVEPFNDILRSSGAITIDNKLYSRYMGELQIAKKTLPADIRCNVIARIPNNELFLLQYIKPNSKFSFIV